MKRAMKFRFSHRTDRKNQDHAPTKPRPIISSPIPVCTLSPWTPDTTPDRSVPPSPYASFDDALGDLAPPLRPNFELISNSLSRECSIFELSPERLLLLPGPTLNEADPRHESNRASRLERRSHVLHVPPEVEEEFDSLPSQDDNEKIPVTLASLPDELLDRICLMICSLSPGEHNCDRGVTQSLYYVSLVNHKLRDISTRHIYSSLRLRTSMELESVLTSLFRFPHPDKQVHSLHLLVDCRPYDFLALSSSFDILDEFAVRLLMHAAPTLTSLLVDIHLACPEIPWNAPYLAFYRDLSFLTEFINTRDSKLTLLNPYGAAFLPWPEWKSLERLALIDQYVDATFVSAILSLPALTHLVLGCPCIQIPRDSPPLPLIALGGATKPLLPFETLLLGVRPSSPSPPRDPPPSSSPSDNNKPDPTPSSLQRIIIITWRSALAVYARHAAQRVSSNGNCTLSVIVTRPISPNSGTDPEQDGDTDDRDTECETIGLWMRHAAEDGSLWDRVECSEVDEDVRVSEACRKCCSGLVGTMGGDIVTAGISVSSSLGTLGVETSTKVEEGDEGDGLQTFELRITEAD